MGSETSADLCGHCDKSLEKTSLSIACDKCEVWFHDSCTGLTKAEEKIIKVSKAVLWFCQRCKEDMNNSSNISTNNSAAKLSLEDDHNNSDNWRKLDIILSTLEANNARFNHIEKTIESNAAECTDKCNAVSIKLHDIHAKLDENVEMLRNEMFALVDEGRMMRDAGPAALQFL